MLLVSIGLRSLSDAAIYKSLSLRATQHYLCGKLLCAFKWSVDQYSKLYIFLKIENEGKKCKPRASCKNEIFQLAKILHNKLPSGFFVFSCFIFVIVCHLRILCCHVRNWSSFSERRVSQDTQSRVYQSYTPKETTLD